VKTAETYKPSNGFGLLLESLPKAGKTTLALMFPDPYIIDCDNNLSGALRWFKQNDPGKLSKIKYDTVNVLDDGTIVEDEKRWERVVDLATAALNDKTIRTIIVDSCTALSKYLEDFIVSRKGAGKKEGMTISDWIPFRNLLGKIVIDLRAKSKGRIIIFTSHEEVVKDESTGVLHYRTNIPSKLADSFGGFFSDVWRCEVSTDATTGVSTHSVRCAKSPVYPALGSSMGLPAIFKFTWPEFQKYLVKYDETIKV